MISIIIPTYNEEERIELVLKHLKQVRSGEVDYRIYIVDGGSTDGTLRIASNYMKEDSEQAIELLQSEKGRSQQLNAGASFALQNSYHPDHILYFLHADSMPPKNFDLDIVKAVDDGHPAGCFRMRFDYNHWWLLLMGWFTRFNHKSCRGGDQSQYITKDLFFEIGGYDESYEIYEDIELIKNLYSKASYHVIPKTLVTSARMYKEIGVLQLQYHYLVIYTKKYFGADAATLKDYYHRKVLKKSTEQVSAEIHQTF